MHADDEGPRVGDDLPGVGGEGAPERDDDGVERVHRHVDHRREVPVDARLAQHDRHAARLGLGGRHVARLPHLACGERRGIAQARGEPHHLATLGVDRDEQRPARALAGEGLQIGGEPRELLGAHDVARVARGDVALEQDHAADLDVADEPAHLVVAVDRGAAEADEQQLGDGQARGTPRRGERRARGHERADEATAMTAKSRPHQRREPRAASTSRLTRSGSTGLARTPSRLTLVPTMSPSAIDRSSAAVSAVAPLPTRSGPWHRAAHALEVAERRRLPGGDAGDDEPVGEAARDGVARLLLDRHRRERHAVLGLHVGEDLDVEAEEPAIAKRVVRAPDWSSP